jgi:acyl-CoA synthetase (AMP-forming)/AMP-acid ligase II
MQLIKREERLADYKIAETLEIVCEVPRNVLGKLDRKLLDYGNAHYRALH